MDENEKGNDMKRPASQNGLSDYQKLWEYHKARVTLRCGVCAYPEYIPCRIRITRKITPYLNTVINPGEMICFANEYGDVYVLSSYGGRVNLKPIEFEVLKWKKNRFFTEDDRL
ncbi:MAG: hypothetical protein DRP45_12070 [Candidatus Zixiibacteriota bacterium]|nr:MAG: hypothetical protein DRP45_12070 [candidate division Zixibacteria bacterium]